MEEGVYWIFKDIDIFILEKKMLIYDKNINTTKYSDMTT